MPHSNQGKISCVFNSLKILYLFYYHCPQRDILLPMYTLNHNPKCSRACCKNFTPLLGFPPTQNLLRSPSRAGIAQSVEHLPDLTLTQWQDDRSQFSAPPIPAHRYVEENILAAMLATKRSAGVTPEVNIRECVTHFHQTLIRLPTLALKLRGDII